MKQPEGRIENQILGVKRLGNLMLYQEFQGEKEDCNLGPLFQVPA